MVFFYCTAQFRWSNKRIQIETYAWYCWHHHPTIVYIQNKILAFIHPIINNCVTNIYTKLSHMLQSYMNMQSCTFIVIRRLTTFLTFRKLKFNIYINELKFFVKNCLTSLERFHCIFFFFALIGIIKNTHIHKYSFFVNLKKLAINIYQANIRELVDGSRLTEFISVPELGK